VTGPTLLTGSTGFIGRRVLEDLLARRQTVRVLVRRPEVLPRWVRDRVEVVVGDLRDRAAVARAAAGASRAVHLAAYARAWASDPGLFDAINVGAVKGLLEALDGAGVRRLVHASTILTLPPRRPSGVTGRAARPTPYERSKRAGERLVDSWGRTAGEAIVVHPTRVYGPGPLTDANGVTRAVRLYLRGRLRARIADGGVLANYVHVEDVARGIRLALDHGRPGRHYILGGPDNVSLEELLRIVATVSGVERHVASLPAGAALLVGRLGELWGRLGGAPSLTRGWVRVFLEDRPADIARANRELGYEPRPLRTGLAETVAWLRNGNAP
jgi:nucleoside-diphosphate-sugar epimerase